MTKLTCERVVAMLGLQNLPLFENMYSGVRNEAIFIKLSNKQVRVCIIEAHSTYRIIFLD